MVALQVDVLLQSSVALHTRVITVGQVPLGVVLTTATSTVWSQASEAVALPQVGVVGQSIVWLAGQFFLMIRLPPRSTLDRSSAASDVYKRQLHTRVITVGQVPLGVVLTT